MKNYGCCSQVEAKSGMASVTIEKAFEKGPENSQTGPAKRNDSKTIEKQLAALQTTEQKDLYTTLTKAIQKHYER